MPRIFSAAARGSSAALDDLDAAALAAAARMDLRLDDRRRRRRACSAPAAASAAVNDDLALRHRHAVTSPGSISPDTRGFSCVDEKALTRSQPRPSVSAQPVNHPRKRRDGSSSGAHSRHRSSRWHGRPREKHQIQSRRWPGLLRSVGFTGIFPLRSARNSSSASPDCLLFAYLILHLAGNALIFAGRRYLQRVLAQAHLQSAADPDRDRAAGRLPAAHLQDGTDGDREPRGPAGALSEEGVRGPHQPQELRLVHDDRVGARRAACSCSIHVKQFKFGAYYQTVSPAPIRDLYRTEIEVFSNPCWVVFYVIGTMVVGLHLRHGIASGFQSIGATIRCIRAA